MIHELKISPEYFEAVDSLHKQFELRKDDRDYKVGDFLLLKEFEEGTYTGRRAFFQISYILRNCPQYGLADGYCILGWQARSEKVKMRLLVRPAWRFIPETVTVEDIEELICAINQELAEVQEALIAYRIEPTEKNLAHIGEELADVVTRAATCFAAIETMPNCPAESFTEHCLEWVFHKNKARGYLDKRGKSDEPAAEDAEEV